MCGFVMDRYLVQQSQQAETLTAAIKAKMGEHQALAEWKRTQELYPNAVKPSQPQWDVVYSGPTIRPDEWFEIDLVRPKPFVPSSFKPPLPPKPQATVAYSGGPLDGDVAKYVEGGAKRVPLHWPSGAFYALETIDTVLTWVYYGDEDVP